MPKGKHTSSMKRTHASPSAQLQRVNLAAARQIRSAFSFTTKREGSSLIISAHVCDSLALLPVKVAPASGETILSDNLPFTLASSNVNLAGLGQVLPKVQGLARIASRFRVRRAVLHWRTLCAASTNGNCGLAIAPGFTNPVDSLSELASFEKGATGALWENYSTPEWRNLEDRWFDCVPTAGLLPLNADQVPFTILRYANVPSGSSFPALIWLELDIDFVDLRPANQASASMEGPASFALANSSSSAAAATVQMVAAQAMEGLWEWAPSLIDYIWSGGTSYNLPAGASIGVDGTQLIEWSSEIAVGAITTSPLDDWDDIKDDGPRSRLIVQRIQSEAETGLTQRAPRSKFRRPPPIPGQLNVDRKRVNFAFRSTAEAAEASRRGLTWDQIRKDFGPNTSGDVTVYLNWQPDQMGASQYTLYSATHSNTSAFTFTDVYEFVATTPGRASVAMVVPAGDQPRHTSSSASPLWDFSVWRSQTSN